MRKSRETWQHRIQPQTHNQTDNNTNTAVDTNILLRMAQNQEAWWMMEEGFVKTT